VHFFFLLLFSRLLLKVLVSQVWLDIFCFGATAAWQGVLWDPRPHSWSPTPRRHSPQTTREQAAELRAVSVVTTEM
jgi:hypothetical protein